jgi:ribonuclease P protein subunit POP4
MKGCNHQCNKSINFFAKFIAKPFYNVPLNIPITTSIRQLQLPCLHSSVMLMYDNKDIVLQELIGLEAKVIKCNDKKQVGVKGMVIDETKNVLFIKTSTGLKKVIKKTAVFKFRAERKLFIVNGKEINFKPVERTEKAMKFYKKRKQ